MIVALLPEYAMKKTPSICNKFVDLTYDYAQVNGQLKVQGLTKT